MFIYTERIVLHSFRQKLKSTSSKTRALSQTHNQAKRLNQSKHFNQVKHFGQDKYI